METFIRSVLLAVALLVSVHPASRLEAAEPAGKSVSVTVGYLTTLGDQPNTIFVQGVYPTWSSDNIFLGLSAEGPTFWGSLYPLASIKWMFRNRYGDKPQYRHIDTHGILLGGGFGYGLDAWQATLRLEALGGYWWEDIEVNYDEDTAVFTGVAPFEVDNDEPAIMLAASLAFPFANRVEAMIHSELVMRPEETINGTLENGRWYRIETHGIYGTISVGLNVALGSE
jgi:hypothetical protein